MKNRFNEAAPRHFFWVRPILLAAILCGMLFPTGAARADIAPFPHFFSGQVLNNSGAPLSGVQVSAWIGGVQVEPSSGEPLITTDEDGYFGSPTQMTVNGQNGDLIVFKVNGTAAAIAEVDGTTQSPPLPSIEFQSEASTELVLVSGLSDTVSPAAVGDLLAREAKDNQVTLGWTAPGDDGNTGRASYYDVRYSTAGPINGTNWDSATQATGEPPPLPAGGAQSFNITGLNSNTTYYFALKTYDEFSNGSALSNCESVMTAATPQGSGFDVFWGTVYNSQWGPAAKVKVQAWVNGRLSYTLATDSEGNLGADGGPYLVAYGYSGESIIFKVNGADSQVRLSPDGPWSPSLTLIGGYEHYQIEIGPPSDTTPPSVTVTSPNGSEKWKVSSSYNITWTATDASGITSVNISYSQDNGVTYTSIANGLANSGSYSWTVPNTKSANCRVKVAARDGAGNWSQDASDAVFKIYLPGDADNNGTVNGDDITKVEQIIMETSSSTPDSDANEDGSINIMDITAIEKMIGP
jgi:hypothetical protein